MKSHVNTLKKRNFEIKVVSPPQLHVNDFYKTFVFRISNSCITWVR